MYIRQTFASILWVTLLCVHQAFMCMCCSACRTRSREHFDWFLCLCTVLLGCVHFFALQYSALCLANTHLFCINNQPLRASLHLSSAVNLGEISFDPRVAVIVPNAIDRKCRPLLEPPRQSKTVCLFGRLKLKCLYISLLRFTV